MSKLSVYIIAYNQITKIEAAIKSVLWADEVVVVDSHSTDGTTELAEKLGARVVQVPFRGFGDLRNQAVAACQYDWIFSLDSDERCTPAARDEILSIINSNDALDIYKIPRKIVLWVVGLSTVVGILIIVNHNSFEKMRSLMSPMSSTKIIAVTATSPWVI